MELFDKYGVLQYLSEHFEILHTQSWQWIMEEALTYLNYIKAEEVYYE